MAFDLEAEVRDLAARRDITDAVQRYMRGLDRLDGPLLRSAFHDDARIDVGLTATGPDDYVPFCMELLVGFGPTHHFLGQIRIELTGTQSAQGECYFQAWHGTRDDQGGERDLFISGRYVDDYTCKNGEWRISRRKLITDWVKDDPANRAYLAANPGVQTGTRDGRDFSQTRD